MNATRRSIVAALVVAALAACGGARVDETQAQPVIVPHDQPVAVVDDAPPTAKTTVVRVRLSAESPFQGPLYASLHRIDDSEVDRRRLVAGDLIARAPFAADRVATLSVPRPGRYAVALDVETLESHIASPGNLGSGAHVTERKPLRTAPAAAVAVVGEDGAPVEVVVAIVADDDR